MSLLSKVKKGDNFMNQESTSKIFKNNVLMVEKFIEHNIDNGNITKQSNIQDLLDIINQVKEFYIPMYSRIEEYVNKIIT